MKSELKNNLAVFIFLIAGAAFASTPVDFYATVSSSEDTNMISMTTDLFYSQLQTINGYTVNDMRDENYSREGASPTHISFYAQIEETAEGWSCTLNAVKADVNKNVSSTKTYGSYYKILLDAKSSLENLLTNLTNSSSDDSYISSSQDNQDNSSGEIAKESALSSGSVTLENLAGTWTGEDFIEKIIMLRGGKGFVIFKNGASMNIEISINSGTVMIKQTGKSNASFFPNLPRNVALENAANAMPIQWLLMVLDGNTLKGTKTTLVEDSTSPTGAKVDVISVTWTRK